MQTEKIRVEFEIKGAALAKQFAESDNNIFLTFGKDFSQTKQETIRQKSEKDDEPDYAYRFKNGALEYLIDCSLSGGRIRPAGSFLAQLTEGAKLIFKTTATAAESLLEIEFNADYTAQVTEIIEKIKYRIDYLKKEDSFWNNEYGAKSFAEKAAFWADGMFRSARWQTESGLDIYDGYTPSWYRFAIDREPDFDQMLVYIFEKYREEFVYNDLSTTEILRRIGHEDLGN